MKQNFFGLCLFFVFFFFLSVSSIIGIDLLCTLQQDRLIYSFFYFLLSCLFWKIIVGRHKNCLIKYRHKPDWWTDGRFSSPRIYWLELFRLLCCKARIFNLFFFNFVLHITTRVRSIYYFFTFFCFHILPNKRIVFEKSKGCDRSDVRCKKNKKNFWLGKPQCLYLRKAKNCYSFRYDF